MKTENQEFIPKTKRYFDSTAPSTSHEFSSMFFTTFVGLLWWLLSRKCSIHKIICVSLRIRGALTDVALFWLVTPLDSRFLEWGTSPRCCDAGGANVVSCSSTIRIGFDVCQWIRNLTLKLDEWTFQTSRAKKKQMVGKWKCNLKRSS